MHVLPALLPTQALFLHVLLALLAELALLLPALIRFFFTLTRAYSRAYVAPASVSMVAIAACEFVLAMKHGVSPLVVA